MAQSTNAKPVTAASKAARNRSLFITALFAVIFISVRIIIHPINNLDYTVHIHGLQAFWNGQSPYTVTGYYDPPWSIFLLAPLVNQPLETWLALEIALFVTSVIDLGTPPTLFEILHPIFITLIASSNPEWLYVGIGLWLIYRVPMGWGRGIAWLFLACKPQTTSFFLLVDGWDALRQHDWKAFVVAAVPALLSWLVFPQFFSQLSKRLDIPWSASVIFHYGIIGAILVTAIIFVVRRHKLADRKTIALLLAPVLTPYTLQYSLMTLLFIMRRAGWWRNIVYVAAGIGLAALFWRDYHVAEQVGILGMILLAALLAPSYGSAYGKSSASQAVIPSSGVPST